VLQLSSLIVDEIKLHRFATGVKVVASARFCFCRLSCCWCVKDRIRRPKGGGGGGE
jgi:hypothetical protein